MVLWHGRESKNDLGRNLHYKKELYFELETKKDRRLEMEECRNERIDSLETYLRKSSNNIHEMPESGSYVDQNKGNAEKELCH